MLTDNIENCLNVTNASQRIRLKSLHKKMDKFVIRVTECDAEV